MTPGRRRWFLSPWPYAGGALALVVFSPVLWWNATHGWESFIYQSGRLTVYDWSGRYFGEFLLDLIALATPPIFILGVAGIVAKPASEPAGARALLASLMGPMLLYFAWHATHVRVQGNWPEPVYPAFSVAAAEAARRWSPSSGWLDAVARWSARLAAPIGLGIAALIYLEVTTGLIPLGAHDLRGRALGVGWPAVADRIDAIRVRSGARGILTTDYTLDGWIKFYLPSHTPVEQMDERVRWTNEPEPDARAFSGPLIYVCDHSCWKLPRVRSRFADVRLVATVDRLSRGRAVSHYQIYRLANPIGPVFDVARDIPQADHND